MAITRPPICPRCDSAILVQYGEAVCFTCGYYPDIPPRAPTYEERTSRVRGSKPRSTFWS